MGVGERWSSEWELRPGVGVQTGSGTDMARAAHTARKGSWSPGETAWYFGPASSTVEYGTVRGPSGSIHTDAMKPGQVLPDLSGSS